MKQTGQINIEQEILNKYDLQKIASNIGIPEHEGDI